jgi:flagellar biosynthesis protein FlhA
LGANDYIVKIKGQAVGRAKPIPSNSWPWTTAPPPARSPAAPKPPSPRSACPLTGSPNPSAPSRAAQLHRRRSHRRHLATHLTELIKGHAHELLTRQEVKNLLDNLKTACPPWIEEVIPTQVKPGELQKVMQNLLRERVPVRDLETILETLGDYASRTKDLEVLTEYVRNALARTICKQYVDERDRSGA